ncbi:MAG: hypothetical protein PHZ00_02500 [Candidatus Peribacteraceae bacterium]|nr:hypothetical protein [Candidatus Peribacteraceae bacterium]
MAKRSTDGTEDPLIQFHSLIEKGDIEGARQLASNLQEKCRKDLLVTMLEQLPDERASNHKDQRTDKALHDQSSRSEDPATGGTKNTRRRRLKKDQPLLETSSTQSVSPTGLPMGRSNVYEAYVHAIRWGEKPPDLSFSENVSASIELAVRHWCAVFWSSRKPAYVLGGRIVAILGVLLTKGLGVSVPIQDLQAQINCDIEGLRPAIREMGKGHLFRQLPWMFNYDRRNCCLIQKDSQSST